VISRLVSVLTSVDNVRALLSETEGTPRDIASLEQSVVDGILKRAVGLLDTYMSIPESDRPTLLSRIDAEAVLFVSVAQQLKSCGESLDALKAVSFEACEGTSLAPKDVECMTSIYQSNYSGERSALGAQLSKRFLEKTKNKQATFYTLRNKEDVVAFLTVEPTQKTTTFHERFPSRSEAPQVYLGSFNTDPSYQGASIGDVMFKKVLDKESKGKVVLADCPATRPIGAKYIEDGFIATAHYDFAGNPSFEIARDDTLSFVSKGMPQEEIVKRFLQKKLGIAPVDDSVHVVSAETQEGVPLDLLKDGHVMTRYFKIRGEEKWYAVFEQAA
jgi:hypothetical protein